MPVSVVWWLARSGGLSRIRVRYGRSVGDLRPSRVGVLVVPYVATAPAASVYLLPKIASDKKWADEAFDCNNLIWRNIPPPEQHSRWAYEAFDYNNLIAVWLTLRAIISQRGLQ